jgi:adenylate cyclase class 2
MSYEVEVKYRSVDHDQLAAQLDRMGATAAGAVDHEDLYFNHPARDFAQTNEAFRLRRVGAANRLTYKGPRHSGPTKTRKEIEVGFADGPDEFRRMAGLFESLGFRPVATIRKRRESFHLNFREHAMEVALDVAELLGCFAEIETIAASQAALPAAQQAVLALASALGLSEVEPRSYLRMVLEPP